jgi:hypothetical protein
VSLLTWKDMCIRHGFTPESKGGIILLSCRRVRRGELSLEVLYHVEIDEYMVYVRSPTEHYQVPLPRNDAEFLAMLI